MLKMRMKIQEKRLYTNVITQLQERFYSALKFWGCSTDNISK